MTRCLLLMTGYLVCTLVHDLVLLVVYTLVIGGGGVVLLSFIEGVCLVCFVCLMGLPMTDFCH